MECPDCNARTNIIDTRHNHHDGETYRRRVCPECGRDFYTMEIEVENNERFQKTWKRNHRPGGKRTNI